MPGEQRRLARPPSERYREAEAKAAADAAERADSSASLARGLALAVIVSLVGALALVMLGAIATVTTGLIVVAGAIGFGVALALQLGARGHLPSGHRVLLAVALTLGAIGLGQLGIWQYARAEGGVLPVIDYLAEVFGPLVIVEFVVGGVVAWAVAR
jgi:formate/nitrite transporter FocA (FNT family)